jgi:hypothetical protein
MTWDADQAAALTAELDQVRAVCRDIAERNLSTVAEGDGPNGRLNGTSLGGEQGLLDAGRDLVNSIRQTFNANR